MHITHVSTARAWAGWREAAWSNAFHRHASPPFSYSTSETSLETHVKHASGFWSVLIQLCALCPAISAWEHL